MYIYIYIYFNNFQNNHLNNSCVITLKTVIIIINIISFLIISFSLNDCFCLLLKSAIYQYIEDIKIDISQKNALLYNGLKKYINMDFIFKFLNFINKLY